MRFPHILNNLIKWYSIVTRANYETEKKGRQKNKRKTEDKNYSGHPRSLERELVERAIGVNK